MYFLSAQYAHLHVEAGTRTTYVFNGDTYLDENGNKLKATLSGGPVLGF